MKSTNQPTAIAIRAFKTSFFLVLMAHIAALHLLTLVERYTMKLNQVIITPIISSVVIIITQRE